MGVEVFKRYIWEALSRFEVESQCRWCGNASDGRSITFRTEASTFVRVFIIKLGDQVSELDANALWGYFGIRVE